MLPALLGRKNIRSARTSSVDKSVGDGIDALAAVCLSNGGEG